MIVSLRKLLFLVLMTLALLAGTLGLSIRAITTPPTQQHRVIGQLGSHRPNVNCPPPPYIC